MLAILVIKTLILVLGSGITFIAYKAHRRTGAPALRALSVGFGIITLGALLAGVAHQLLGVELQTGVLINSLLVAVGLAIIMYSLYIQK
ncbi:DUF7521 family protein [Halogeometricum luteum]|uniref:Uncharacterized protein n=1 Tax=Halogeometricum luteum TaxID=2950537 RepID=A0ABU2G7U8_9EURY|nr:hypothetical protein [Halogeometricum sp. S3BR5-2]MDS0296870.1 hypothetical protein [Halogeometricum sp. S3BR5-2]